MQTTTEKEGASECTGYLCNPAIAGMALFMLAPQAKKQG